MKRSKAYWLKRRDQLFEREAQFSRKELADNYLRLYQQTSADLLSLLEEIEKGVIHEGGVNERPILVSDLYRCEKYYDMLTNFTANALNLGSKELVTIDKTLTDMYHKQVQLTSDELGPINIKFFFNNPEVVQKTINAVWCADGKNWSDRVWNNVTEMQAELQKGIVDIVATGKNPQDVIVKLKSFVKGDINKGFNRADRLVRTELSYVQTQATLDKYAEAGVEYYEILAANGACSDCASTWDGQKFRVAEAQVGKNCPPFHPNCRCTTLAVLGKGD